MKIAVVTIAKNEAKHVARWADSAREADLLLIGDTGSTDDTRERAAVHGVQTVDLSIDPWRFDDARNALHALIPQWIDVVVTLDMDEVLLPNWRSFLEAAEPGADRYTYYYEWSDDISFTGERCISRNNWRWKHPVHETLQWMGDGQPVERPGGFAIQHLPDHDKPRSQYLPMLRQAVAESPDDDRIAFYYARELYLQNQWVQARVEFMRHLELPSSNIPGERCQSYRYLAKMDDFPERWILKAIGEAPWLREPWVDWMQWLMDNGHHQEALGAYARAKRITARSMLYYEEAYAWDNNLLDKRRDQILEKSREDADVP